MMSLFVLPPKPNTFFFIISYPFFAFFFIFIFLYTRSPPLPPPPLFFGSLWLSDAAAESKAEEATPADGAAEATESKDD